MAPIFPTNCFLDSPFSKFLGDLDFTLIDAGMRGGAEPDLLPIAFATHVIGFEPEPRAYEALVSAAPGPWKSQKILPLALSDRKREVRLFVTDDPQSSSTFEPDQRFGQIYGKQQFFKIDHNLDVKATTLDAVLSDRVAPAPGFLKLDVEGAEAEILAGAKDTLKHLALVKVEVSTLRFNSGQPVFGDIDRVLCARGFRLFDLLTLHRWRRAGDVIHPHFSGGSTPYARGALMHGDALYVRDVFPGGDEARDHALALRAVAGLLSYGYFDHALMVLQQDSLSQRVQSEYGLDPAAGMAFASRKFGRSAWLRAFRNHVRELGTFARSGLKVLGIGS